MDRESKIHKAFQIVHDDEIAESLADRMTWEQLVKLVEDVQAVSTSRAQREIQHIFATNRTNHRKLKAFCTLGNCDYVGAPRDLDH